MASTQLLFATVIVNLCLLGIQAQDPCLTGFALPEHYHNGMVLQADQNIEVWGFVDDSCPGVNVQQTCGTRVTKGQARIESPSRQSRATTIFAAPLPSSANGEECTLEFSGTTDVLATLDVIYGDVWICSGQSNMERDMSSIFNASEEVAASAGYTNIRMYEAGHKYSDVPLETLDPSVPNWDGWYTPDNANYLNAFSAVCFLYARELTDRVVGPNYVFGLIGTYWGGTRVEAWSSSTSLTACNAPPNPDEPGSPQNADSALYNGMLVPFMRDSIYGALWYQGESNAGYNQDLYACTFYGMIDDWRNTWTLSNPDFPFGFVQLGTNIGQSGVPIRWHQTNDQGTVSGSVFMAFCMDTYDEDGGIHPRNKQIVGERLCTTGANTAYGVTESPTNGPFPDFTVQAPLLRLEYPDGPDSFTYDNTEISGFYACCVDFDSCDATAATGGVTSWTKIDKANVVATPEDGLVYIDYSTECNNDPNAVTGIAYLWEDIPVQGMLAAPIYANDAYRLPAAPWKYCLNC